MSINDIVSGIAQFGELIGDAVSNYALIQPGDRAIGDLYPHVVVEENHRDELAITQHPVEFGAPVTDHAFMQPYTVEIRCGWSDSTAATSGYVQAVYAALLALQTSRTPFDIATGKRSYTSMLMRMVAVKTDPDSEYALMVVATAQQIIITSTSQTSATPELTNGSTQVGTVNPAGFPAQPTAAGDNGIGTIPAGTQFPSFSADGAVTFANGAAPGGTQMLAPAPLGAPAPYAGLG